MSKNGLNFRAYTPKMGIKKRQWRLFKMLWKQSNQAKLRKENFPMWSSKLPESTKWITTYSKWIELCIWEPKSLLNWSTTSMQSGLSGQKCFLKRDFIKMPSEWSSMFYLERRHMENQQRNKRWRRMKSCWNPIPEYGNFISICKSHLETLKQRNWLTRDANSIDALLQ